jgi:hypothetical protein
MASPRFRIEPSTASSACVLCGGTSDSSSASSSCWRSSADSERSEPWPFWVVVTGRLPRTACEVCRRADCRPNQGLPWRPPRSRALAAAQAPARTAAAGMVEDAPFGQMPATPARQPVQSLALERPQPVDRLNTAVSWASDLVGQKNGMGSVEPARTGERAPATLARITSALDSTIE